MSSYDTIVSVVSLGVAFATVIVTASLMARQAREMAHERNALAILEAIDRLSSSELVAAFDQLRGANERYPTDEAYATDYPGSTDAQADMVVGQFMETVACL